MSVSCGWQLTGRNTLDTTSASETSDSGLGDTLDVVSQDLSVTLGTALAETLAALAACDDCKLGEETHEGRVRNASMVVEHADASCYLRPVILIEGELVVCGMCIHS
jgi:predicted trehalose synthase